MKKASDDRSRRRWFWLVALGAMVIGVSVVVYQALLPGGALSSQRVYASAASGFSLAYPADWTVLQDYEGTDVVLLAPKQDDAAFQDNINVRHIQTAQQAAVEAQSIVDELRSAGADVNLLEQGSDDDLGRGSMHFVYDLRIQGQELSVVSYIMRHGDTYFITCTTVPQRLAAFRKTCGTVAGSVRFRRD